MTTLIKNSVIHFAKILKVYTVLALVGAGIAVLAQLAASYYSVEHIALTAALIFTCISLVSRQSNKAKNKTEEALPSDVSPRLKKS